MVSPSPALPTALQQLFEQHQGLLTRSQVLAAHLPPHWLGHYTNSGQIERAQRGVYRLAEAEGFSHESLLQVALRIPQAVVCSYSALAFHNLGTFLGPSTRPDGAGRSIPNSIHLAIPQKARRPKLEYPPLELYYFSPKPFGYGIEHHPVGAGVLRVYSKEKTLADGLRLKQRVEYSVVLESLKAYLALQERNIPLLLAAAKVCRVEVAMRVLVQAMLA
jgi:predicted transcriptional regulator of viral defense system